jgi:ribosomal-protein-alanine N-acetyltransferase
MTPDSFAIVPMERRYLEDVLVIERQSFSDPWPAQAFTVEEDNAYAFFRVAGKPAPEGLARVDGFVLCYLLPEDAHLINLAVRPECRRRGLGRALLDCALEEFSRRGGGTIGLEVRVSNRAARTMYETAGFRTVAVRRGYYRKENEDALLMVLAVPGAAAASLEAAP